MEFRILGPLEIRDGARIVECRGAKQRLVLAVLLLHANEVVSTDRLIDDLWSERPPATAPKALQVHISELRKLLGRDFIATRAPGYELRLGPDDLDLWRFERAVQDARAAADAGRVDEAASALSDALGLWRGAPLADLTFEDALQADIATLEERRLAVLEQRIELDLALGRHAELTAELEALAAHHPLRERLRAQLILALYRAGRQADALEAYRDIRRLLVDELGIEPGRELRELEASVLAQDEALDAPMAEPVRDQRGQLSGPLIGRDREMGTVLPAVERALAAGRGAAVLIGGDPGIGKSRFAQAVAREAERRGARVVVGRCWEAGDAPPYWPWEQALRPHLAGGDLHQLAPADAAGSQSGQFRLFEAVGALLRRLASDQPLAIFFDDLHAADASSLLLLRFAAAALEDVPVLVVACYRSTEVGTELDETLADLARQTTAEHLVLQGMDSSGTRGLLEEAMDRPPAPELVDRVQARTGGNPLFTSEVGRLLVSGDWDATAGAEHDFPVPEGIRAAIASRIQRHSAECRELLELASVIGRQFEPPQLGHLSARGEEEVLATLDEAHEARILETVPRVPGALRFSHVLIRDALYEQLPPGRRLQLHRQVAGTIETLHANRLDPWLSELANHYRLAGRESLPKAVDYTIRAGDYAAKQLGYEQAARHYGAALALMEEAATSDAGRACEVTLSLGDVLSRSGDDAAAKAAFREAAAIAEEAGRADQLVRAALGYGGRFPWARASTDPALVPLYERALAAVRDADSAARALLLVRLAAARRDYQPIEQRRAMTDEAVALARRLGDPVVLGHVLSGRGPAAEGPDTVPMRLPRADELLALAAEIGDAELAYQGHAYRMHAHWTLADRPGVDVELDAMGALADELRQPAHRWEYTASLTIVSLMEGEFERAEELIVQTAALGERAQTWNAGVSERLALFALRREQGRLAEVEDMMKRAAHEYRALLRFQTALAHLHAELGHERAARAALDNLLARDLAGENWDEEWLVAMNLLPDVCAFLRDDDAARRLYDVMFPYARLYADAPSEAPFGSVARALGVLARTFGELDDAVAHLESAIEIESSMCARPWVAHAQHDLAQALLSRDGSGDQMRAAELARTAAAEYRELGMASWVERAGRLTAGAAIGQSRK